MGTFTRCAGEIFKSFKVTDLNGAVAAAMRKSISAGSRIRPTLPSKLLGGFGFPLTCTRGAASPQRLCPEAQAAGEFVACAVGRFHERKFLSLLLCACVIFFGVAVRDVVSSSL
jgi:hypothetical protein